MVVLFTDERGELSERPGSVGWAGSSVSWTRRPDSLSYNGLRSDPSRRTCSRSPGRAVDAVCLCSGDDPDGSPASSDAFVRTVVRAVWWRESLRALPDLALDTSSPCGRSTSNCDRPPGLS